jgi:hypothetical protein
MMAKCENNDLTLSTSKECAWKSLMDSPMLNSKFKLIFREKIKLLTRKMFKILNEDLYYVKNCTWNSSFDLLVYLI